MKSKKEAIIDRIEEVRTDNNKLWMGVLRISMDAAPIKTKKLLAKIQENDKKISELMGTLTYGNL